MKNSWKFWLGLACVAGLSYGLSNATAQTAKPPAKAGETVHKVGLIDMAEVFKNYAKFQTLRDDLAEKIKQSEGKAKVIADRVQVLASELKSGTFAPTSTEATDREKEITRLSGEFEAFKKNTQRELMREESKMYHQIYTEASDAVQVWAKHFHYTLVMRFSREELDNTDPQKIIQSLNRQVVYFQKEDDITDGVVEYMNRPYKKTATRPAAAVTPTGATSTTR